MGLALQTGLVAFRDDTTYGLPQIAGILGQEMTLFS